MPNHEPDDRAPWLALLFCLGALSCGPRPSGSAGAEGGEHGLVILPDPDSAAEDPDLMPRPYYHDFGNVPDGDTVEHVFRLRNVEPTPVAIRKVVPSCGCTVPAVAYRDGTGELVRGEGIRSGADPLLVVPPGAQAELSIRVDSRDVRSKNVDKLLFVNVTTDAAEHLYLKFEAHIKVESPFLLTPNGIDLATVARGAGGRGSCDIVVAPGYAHRVEGVIEKPDDVDVDIRFEQRFGRAVWVVSAELLPPLELGRQTRWVKIGTVDGEGRPYRPITLGVTAFVTRDVIADPARLVLVTERGSTEVVVSEVRLHSLLEGQRLQITGARLEPDHPDRLEAAWEPVDPDARGRSPQWRVSLRTRPPLADELLRGTLRVLLDDPQTPEVEIPYVVHVR